MLVPVRIRTAVRNQESDQSGAQVSVTSGAQPGPVQLQQLTGTDSGAGGVRIMLDGWEAELALSER